MVNLAANERENTLLATGCNAWYFQNDMSCKYCCHCPLLCLLCLYLLHLPEFPLTQQPTRSSLSRSQQPLLLLPQQLPSMLAIEILTNNAGDLSQLLRKDSQPLWPVTFNVAASVTWSDHIMAVLSDDRAGTCRGIKLGVKWTFWLQITKKICHGTWYNAW